ncbi:hypothetical protein AAMO2058_000721600 [Amorphochlora amoebiformis]
MESCIRGTVGVEIEPRNSQEFVFVVPFFFTFALFFCAFVPRPRNTNKLEISAHKSTLHSTSHASTASRTSGKKSSRRTKVYETLGSLGMDEAQDVNTGSSWRLPDDGLVESIGSASTPSVDRNSCDSRCQRHELTVSLTQDEEEARRRSLHRKARKDSNALREARDQFEIEYRPGRGGKWRDRIREIEERYAHPAPSTPSSAASRSIQERIETKGKSIAHKGVANPDKDGKSEKKRDRTSRRRCKRRCGGNKGSLHILGDMLDRDPSYFDPGLGVWLPLRLVRHVSRLRSAQNWFRNATKSLRRVVRTLWEARVLGPEFPDAWQGSGATPAAQWLDGFLFETINSNDESNLIRQVYNDLTQRTPDSSRDSDEANGLRRSQKRVFEDAGDAIPTPSPTTLPDVLKETLRKGGAVSSHFLEDGLQDGSVSSFRTRTSESDDIGESSKSVSNRLEMSSVDSSAASTPDVSRIESQPSKKNHISMPSNPTLKLLVQPPDPNNPSSILPLACKLVCNSTNTSTSDAVLELKHNSIRPSPPKFPQSNHNHNPSLPKGLWVVEIGEREEEDDRKSPGDGKGNLENSEKIPEPSRNQTDSALHRLYHLVRDECESRPRWVVGVDGQHCPCGTCGMMGRDRARVGLGGVMPIPRALGDSLQRICVGRGGCERDMWEAIFRAETGQVGENGEGGPGLGTVSLLECLIRTNATSWISALWNVYEFYTNYFGSNIEAMLESRLPKAYRDSSELLLGGAMGLDGNLPTRSDVWAEKKKRGSISDVDCLTIHLETALFDATFDPNPPMIPTTGKPKAPSLPTHPLLALRMPRETGAPNPYDALIRKIDEAESNSASPLPEESLPLRVIFAQTGPKGNLGVLAGSIREPLVPRKELNFGGLSRVYGKREKYRVRKFAETVRDPQAKRAILEAVERALNRSAPNSQSVSGGEGTDVELQESQLREKIVSFVESQQAFQEPFNETQYNINYGLNALTRAPGTLPFPESDSSESEDSAAYGDWPLGDPEAEALAANQTLEKSMRRVPEYIRRKLEFFAMHNSREALKGSNSTEISKIFSQMKDSDRLDRMIQLDQIRLLLDVNSSYTTSKANTSKSHRLPGIPSTPTPILTLPLTLL